MLKLLVILPLLLGGCVASNFTEFAKAMSGDTASVCLKMTTTTPMGTHILRVARTNIAGGTVVCNDDGLSVKSAVP